MIYLQNKSNIPLSTANLLVNLGDLSYNNTIIENYIHQELLHSENIYERI
jgi:hypothetical protein